MDVRSRRRIRHRARPAPHPGRHIGDPRYTPQAQARENPYYILRHYGYWQRVYYYDHGGGSSYTKTETTQVGLTTTNSTTVEQTTGISVTSDAAFAFRGVEAALSATIEYELKVTTTTETTQEASREIEITREYEAGRRVSEAIWYRNDKYVLERLDATAVLEWTTRDPSTAIVGAYIAPEPPAP